ncbi:PepSY-associated TM helix domain-containing protein [Amphiplicatus metriothermophilus]|uniref:Uncharacterized iron-regulated membrane protein n=1 Tax=Amphiplicatus metriothermophilus TaxID=1519374 RepID=A0A239PY93_9PROT|nr:PepSY-associated TM helix domain-containing protein [Amphiplicatus metriothermophilus]MBB5519001.1 putative iron-regulated membrane protein [Amphiplicatus metriothermophilus]SNT74627.1 Uncharacterized iron-regulated membrane protein [Amphiplicatus metriothermophilus]
MTASIWPKSSSKLVAKAASGHSAIGLAVAALIYVLCVSGAIAVFNHELQRWEQPGAPEISAISPDAAERAAKTVLAAEAGRTSHFYIQLPTDDMPRVVLTTDTQAVFADAEGNIVGAEAHPWTQFVLDLHYYLHLPHTLGITIVGILGVMLLGLAMSGFIAHPRIFRDAFTFRFAGNARVTQTDLHNRLSVWTAPFHVPVALTGAWIGLASIVGYALATLDYGGDLEAAFAPVFGEEPAEDGAPAPLAGIANALAYMAANEPDVKPTYVIMHEPMTRGQHLQVLAEHDRRLIFGEYYNFDANGGFVGTVGMADGTLGQQIAASTYRVHFGSFGGAPVKIIYGVLGAALAFITASGMTIYFLKRREKARPAPRLEAMWAGVVWGTPAALALTMLASVVGLAGPSALPAGFWLALAGFIVAAALRPDRRRVAARLRALAAAALALALAIHAGLHQDAFFSPAAVWTSLVGGLIALAFVAPEIRARAAGRRARTGAATIRQPAE